MSLPSDTMGVTALNDDFIRSFCEILQICEYFFITEIVRPTQMIQLTMTVLKFGEKNMNSQVVS